MIKRPNKYIYGIILTTALSSNVVLAIDNKEKGSEEININKNNEDVTILMAVPLDLETRKQELQQVIDKATQIYRDASIGEHEGQYPIESASVLNNITIKASGILQSDSSTEEDLLNAKLELEYVIASFLSSRIDLSALKTELLTNITETTQLYNESEVGFEKGQYTESAKQSLLRAITTAEEAYNAPVLTREGIKAAIDDLKEAKETFINSVIKEVDVKALVSKIAELELYGQSIIVGGNPGKYPQSEKDKFDAAIKEAQSILDTCTYQESLDMIAKLDKAKSDLENSLIKYEDIIRKDLKEQIEAAEKLRDSAIIGTKPGEYTQESVNKLYSAIYSAKLTDEDGSASQEDIDNATNKIKAAITEFKDSIIDKEIIDLSEIMGLIAQAEKLVFETAVGDEIGQIPKGEKEKLQIVIDSTKKIVNLNSPTQEDINQASNELKEAIAAFRDKIIKEVYKGYLSDEIGKAEAFQLTITEDMIGENIGQYPASAKAKLDKAISDAQKILLSDTATQKAVDDMTESLRNALKDFKASMVTELLDKSKLEEAIKRAEDILKEAVVGDKDGMYPKKEYDKLQAVVKDAKNTLESILLTQSFIDSKTTELESTIEAFLKSENIQYKSFRSQLEVKISECIDAHTSSTDGESVGEYPSNVRTKFKEAIDKAKAVLERNSKVSNDYIRALEELERAKNIFESGVISGEDITQHLEEMKILLNEISTRIKEADTSSEYGRIPENKKIALSVIYSKLSRIGDDIENLAIVKEGIETAKNAISDFDDRSIYIDDKNIVHGRKLTGQVGENNTGRPSVNIIDKKEFIPKAGMPFDIKGALASIGTAFVCVGGYMFKRKK